MSTNPHNPRSQDARRPAAAVILAAGKGTRMNSDLPKVMHCALGKPLVHWVVDACIGVGVPRIILVVGHGADLVRAHFAGTGLPVEFVTQSQQLGTGHAVDQSRAALASLAPSDEILVLCGDGPLITAATLQRLLDAHRSTHAEATMATSVIPDATGYGRIQRDASGSFAAIVEQKDCTPEQLAIREINPSYYCFAHGALFGTLSRIDNRNANGEHYITDVFGLLRADGRTVHVVDAVPPSEVLSVNTPQQLAEVESILRARGGTAPMETAR
jgi:bifunctional UDP-N-acetylglucosamine pyrophosphorylase/glucosamine-1-phosphate N-acetyltransferase